MRKEEDSMPHEKYLLAYELFSNELITIWQDKCVAKYRDKEKGKEYYKFVQWEKKRNEIALFILYAYADIEVPRKFDCIFEIDNPSNVVFEKLELTQSIHELNYPMDSLEQGYKHLCIFEFENELPSILDGIHIARAQFSNAPRNSMRLGICQSNDFGEIRKRLEFTIGLKEKYGEEWRKYLEQE